MPIQTAADSISNSAGSPYGFKNRIINGAMSIDQRNAGGAATANDGTFSVDRWKCVATVNGKFAMQQNAGSITPPAGYSYYLGCTSSSAYSVGSGDFFSLCQIIEGYNFADLGWGTANAKAITLSFWVYSSLTGTFGGTLTNAAGNRSYPFGYTVSSANIWTQISVTIPGDTSGTWLTTTGAGVQVRFGLGAGSTYSGTANVWAGTYYSQPTSSVSVVGTNGATFYVTGVQLEKGSQSTAFDWRPYSTETQLCQRYFFRTASTAGYGFPCFDGYCASGYFASNASSLPVQMRAAPTGTVGGSFGLSNCSSLSVVETDRNGFFMAAVASGTGMVYWHPNSSGYVSFSAEI